MLIPTMLRLAEPHEAERLMALAERSQAHWGYELTAIQLKLTPEYIAHNPVYVLEQGGALIGFYGLTSGVHEMELEYMFLEPEFIGQGMGRQMWQHAVATARFLGYDILQGISNPYAIAFYQAMGAERSGDICSLEGRLLPLFQFKIAENLK